LSSPRRRDLSKLILGSTSRYDLGPATYRLGLTEVGDIGIYLFRVLSQGNSKLLWGADPEVRRCRERRRRRTWRAQRAMDLEANAVSSKPGSEHRRVTACEVIEGEALQVDGINHGRAVHHLSCDSRDYVSGVLREAQVQTTVARIQPARGDHLAAGEEVETLDTVSVSITEQ